MIGTRTARAALFGLVGLFAGLALPTIAAARPVPVASGPTMRGPSVDTRSAEHAGTTVAGRAGDVEIRGSQAPVVGFVPTTAPHRFAALFAIVTIGVAVAAAAPISLTPARAPPLCSPLS